MNIIYKLIFVFFCITIINGCTMYIPVLPNVPLLKNRNEFQSEACLSPDGLHGKLAFSPIKHIGINLNGQYFQQISTLFGSKGDFHKYIDGSLGFYSNYKNKLFFEIYFGYGNGISRMDLYIDDAHYNWYKYNRGVYDKRYGQINLALESKSGNQFGLSNRYGYINYKLDNTAFRWLGTENILHTTWEPSLFYIIKINEKLRFTCYAGAVIVSGDGGEHHKQTIFTNKLSAGVGLKLVLGRKENGF